MKYVRVLCCAVVVMLAACGQGSGPPAAPISLETAAARWNTTDKTWDDAGLSRLINGEQLYRKRCAGCHLSSGEGQLTLGASALKNNSFATGATDILIATVLSGRGSMPAFRHSMTDEDLALILTYIRNAWGNNRGDVVSAAEVAAARKSGG